MYRRTSDWMNWQKPGIGPVVSRRRTITPRPAGADPKHRNALSHLPSPARVDSAFSPTLDAIEITLPSQLEAVKALAASGDWEAVRLRLDHELSRWRPRPRPWWQISIRK